MIQARALVLAGVLVGCGPPSADTACVSDEKQATVRGFLADAGVRLEERTRASIAQAMLAAECEFQIDAYLLLAVAERETRFDPSAQGPRGAIGLLQVQPATASEVARSLELPADAVDLWNVRTNIRLGAAYLRYLRERLGDGWEQILVAYNAGPTRVRRLQRRGIRPTSAYARAVLRRFDALKER